MDNRTRDTEHGLLGRNKGGVKYLSPSTPWLLYVAIAICCGLLLTLSYSYNSTGLFAGSTLLISILAVIGIVAHRLGRVVQTQNQSCPTDHEAHHASDTTVPLWGIMGMADLLMGTPLASEQQELAHVIHRMAQQLHDQIAHPEYTIPKNTSAPPSGETIFNLRQLIDSVTQSLQDRTKQRSQTFQIQIAEDVPARLQGDPVQLRLLLCNLIGDAFFRLPEGSKIHLHIQKAEAKDTFLSQPILHLEFHARGFFPAKHTSGALSEMAMPTLSSLTRQLLIQYGASHGLDIQTGRSAIWVDLPVEIPDGSEAISTQAPLRNMRVLLITTDDALRALLQEQLGGWQVTQTTCQSSLQAFAELIHASHHDESYAATLIDTRSLDMRPEQFVQLIRQEKTLDTITLISLCPTSEPLHGSTSTSPFDVCLQLPIDKTMLFNALHDRQLTDTGNCKISRLIDRYGQNRHGASSLDILLAATDKTNRLQIRKILERAGHRVYVVDNGERALNALDTQHFDLAIMEKQLPVMSGIEAVKLHRFTHVEGNWMPFIMLVPDADPVAIQQCQMADVDTCLAGPIKAHELLEHIKRLSPGKEEETRPPTSTGQPLGGLQSDTQNRQHYQAILGQSTLSELQKLGAGRDFVSNLINNFLQDSDYLLSQMESAYHLHQYQAYIDLAHTFKDSAGNLGALAIYNLSVSASRLSEADFVTEGGALVTAIRKAFDLTRQALMNYLRHEDDSISSQ